MRKRLLGLALAAVTFGMVSQSGTANAFLLNDRSPSVTAAQIIVGGSMTGAFFALTCHHGHCSNFGTGANLKWYGLTTVGCMALTPMVGAAFVAWNEHRELRSSEAMMMLADCVVPIIGGLIVKSAYDAHPEWDAGTGGPTRR